MKAPSGRTPASEAASYLLFGAAAACAQVVALRALLNRFDGNELLIGFGLFVWLTGSGLGAALAGRLIARRNPGLSPDPSAAGPPAFAAGAALLFTPALALGLRFIREAHAALGLSETLAVSPLTALLAGAVALAPATWLGGALFAFLVHESRSRFGEALRSISLWEAVGSGLGGLLFTVLLIDHLGTRGLIGVCFGLNALFVLLRLRGFFWRVAGALALLLSAWPVWNWSAPPETFAGLPVVEQAENRFGTLTVVRDRDQRSLFDGHRLVSYGGAWEEREEMALATAGFRPDAEHVLALGGALQAARGLLALDRAAVDYVQPNVQQVEVEQRLGGIGAKEEDAPRFRITAADERLAVKQAGAHVFDLIVVNGAELDTIASSRLATREFFGAAGPKLAEGGEGRPPGMLLLGFGRPLNYISPPEAERLAAVFLAARTVFPHCRILPLNRYWLACSNGPVGIDPARIMENRLKSSRPPPAALNRRWLEERLHPGRLAELDEAIGRAALHVPPNSDFAPAAPYYSLAYSSGRFSTAAFQWFQQARRGLPAVLLALAALTLAAALLARSRRGAVAAALLAAGIIGGAGLAAELVLMTVYQSGYGLLYHRLGAMSAAYLFGLGLGAHAAERLVPEGGPRLRRFAFYASAGCGSIMALTYLALPWLNGGLAEGSATGLSVLLLTALALFAGALFQLAARVVKEEGERPSATVAGFLRLADHAGASVAALVTGAVLIPLAGLDHTTALLTGLAFLAALAWKGK